jgi:hypothetical protein
MRRTSMPRIRCKYVDCIYLESGLCGADQIDLDPELGCLTFAQEEEEDLAIEKEEEWEKGPVLDEEEDEDWDEDELEEDLDEDDEDEDDEDEDW